MKVLYISNGYRNTGEYITDLSIPISKPHNIRFDLLSLLEKYNKEWNYMDPYEREARFHIEFIRIHLFEDGNGRTGRLLLNYNLMSRGLYPVIITTELDEYYRSYIKNNDIKGMVNIFKIQSKREAEVFKELYDNYIKQNDVINVKK